MNHPKSILCYGDSNTWGYIPETKNRYPRNQRWTGVLQNLLGIKYYVIEEGLNGRTTVHDDVLEVGRNGKEYLLSCLRSHKPVDIVILLLGTNDLKNRYRVSAQEISKGIEVLVKIILKSETGPDDGSPEILIISPPVLGKLTEYKDQFEGGIEKSYKLADWYSQIAEVHSCHFFDAGKIISSSDVDGIHLDVENHLILGQIMAEKIANIFENKSMF